MEAERRGPARDRTRYTNADKVAVRGFKDYARPHGWPCWSDSSVCGDYGYFYECPRLA